MDHQGDVVAHLVELMVHLEDVVAHLGDLVVHERDEKFSYKFKLAQKAVKVQSLAPTA